MTTFELLPEKARLAQDTLRSAKVETEAKLVVGDALAHVGKLRDIGFCFLDAEKEIYQQCYDLVIPNLVPGGLLLTDNAISHGDGLGPMLERALNDSRVDATVVEG